ncbi:MAG: DUF1667 domain-containing protein [Eubacteriales bacterium]
MKKEMTCIICPRGCLLTADFSGEEITVVGNGCRRGEEYAKSELTNPVRTLTTTVKIKSKESTVLPVRTDKPIKKDEIFAAMKKIADIEVSAPIKIGDIIVPDFMDEGVNLISAKTVER